MSKDIKEIKDLPGIGPQAAEKLFGAGYKSLESVAVSSPMELVEVAALGELTAAKAIKAARDALETGFESADKLAEKRKLVGRITTASKEVDELIGGGIETQSITEIYGKFASGKSQWCFQTSVTAQLSKDKGGLAGNILYIDPEVEERQLKRLEGVKHDRNDAAVSEALAAVSAAAGDPTINTMPPILDAVRQYATVGERNLHATTADLDDNAGHVGVIDCNANQITDPPPCVRGP